MFRELQSRKRQYSVINYGGDHIQINTKILSEFIKVTNDTKREVKPQIFGTIVTNGDINYVRIDGSDILTPITTTTEIKNGERVTIAINNHKVTVTGNISNPSAGGDRVDVIDETIIEQNSSIDILKNQITLKVNEETYLEDKNNMNNKITSNTSSIDILKNQITLKVNEETYLQDKNNMNNKITSNTSSIDILKNQITLKVEQTDIDNTVNDSITQAMAEIKITTDSITQEVSKKTDSSEIISTINQTAESISIDASKVNLSGYATFDSLSAEGSTVINGGNIKTGTITGVKVITRSEGSRAEFVNDGITFYNNEIKIGTISYDTDNKLWFRSLNNNPIKIESVDNLSISTPIDKNIYMATNRMIFNGNMTINGAITLASNIVSNNGTMTARSMIGTNSLVSAGKIRLDRAETYLPQVSTTGVIDRIRIGDIFFACGSSGHFVTNNGGIPVMYIGDARTTTFMASDGVFVNDTIVISENNIIPTDGVLDNIIFKNTNPYNKSEDYSLFMDVTNILNTKYVKVDESGNIFSNDHELLKLALLEIQTLKTKII